MGNKRIIKYTKLILFYTILLFVLITPAISSPIEDNTVSSWLKALNSNIINSSYNESITSTSSANITTKSVEHSVLFSEPSINEKCIDYILSSSLAKENGSAFVKYGQEYNINPAFVLALFRQENSLCNTFVKGSSEFTGCKNKSIGNITCTTQSCYKGFNTYSSWEKGIKATYNQLKNGTYYIKSGKTTIETIYPIWANVALNSNEMSNIISFYEQYNSYAGKTC